jgi:fatty-acyl-CoA synthase
MTVIQSQDNIFLEDTLNIKNTVPMAPTQTLNELKLVLADFSNLADALDYAADGVTGYNFYHGNNLYATLPYSRLRDEAKAIARCLCGLGMERGARVALVADTDPDFLRFFFACQYAGLVPVPLPAFVHIGGHKTFVAQLQRFIEISGAEIAVAPQAFFDLLTEACNGLNLRFKGTPEAFAKLPESKAALCPLHGGELAYLQYTSGSTRFPRAVMITQNAIMSNLKDISVHGAKICRGDRCVSWLPFYHDMGLVGLVLVPVATQMSVDYMSPRDFAMRPRQWLRLMTDNRGTISFAPPFGYELCVRRVRQSDLDGFDFSNWRIAGVGAEMIRPGILEDFAKVFAPSKFDKKAFVPSYGMAECTLAASFTPLGQGLEVDIVDGDRLAQSQEAFPVDPDQKTDPANIKTFVICGVPMPEYEIEVRDSQGQVLPERHCGTLFIRGPSVTVGYFRDMAKTREVLSDDGWLNTGDIAYRISDKIVITGRQKDIIIINGRNVWPQDLEVLAEVQPEVISGGAAAFSIPGPEGEEKAAMLIEYRNLDKIECAELTKRLSSVILMEYGIDCLIHMVPRNTIPRTTSGKLSRVRARQIFLEQLN